MINIVKPPIRRWLYFLYCETSVLFLIEKRKGYSAASPELAMPTRGPITISLSFNFGASLIYKGFSNHLWPYYGIEILLILFILLVTFDQFISCFYLVGVSLL